VGNGVGKFQLHIDHFSVHRSAARSMPRSHMSFWILCIITTGNSYSAHIQLLTQLNEQDCINELPPCQPNEYRCADGRCVATIGACCGRGACGECDRPICWNGVCSAENASCPAVPSCPVSLPYRSLSLLAASF
jgi:hypothetical protein